MAWNWKGLAVLIVVGGGYYAYTKYSETANMCGRSETESVIARLIKENSIGTDATVAEISTLKTDGNQTFCSASISFKNILGQSVKKSGVEYNVHPTDDHKSIYVQMPGPSISELRN